MFLFDSGLFQPIFRREAETKKFFVTVYRGYAEIFFFFLGNREEKKVIRSKGLLVLESLQ